MKKELPFLALIAILMCCQMPANPSSLFTLSYSAKQSSAKSGTNLLSTMSNVSNISQGSFPGVKDDFCFASGSENDIYAIASDGNVWHWNGAWWWQVTSGLTIENRIQAVSSDLIYGLSRNSEGYFDIYKWNGSNWTALTINGLITNDFHFASENEIYAVGQDNQVHLWNGYSWREITSGQLGVRNHIQVISSSQIYGISTQGELLKWDERAWQILGSGMNITDFFSLKSENETYAIDQNQRVILWNGHTWRNLTTGMLGRGRVFVNSLTEIFRLSLDKMIWQWNGEKWVQVTTSVTDSYNEVGSTFYRAKYIEGMLECPPAILAFHDRLIIAGAGIGGNIYIREWKPLRNESWDAARNAMNTGVNTWYSLDGTTITTPELTVENGTPFIYVKSSEGGIYKKQYLAPYHWSPLWEVTGDHEFAPGPLSSAGFTIVPSNSSGYPSPVSLVKFKPFNLTYSAPEWIKDLIIYELPTKVFTSPNGPGSGTFKSTLEKLDYLKDLGINAIWLTGHSWSDPRHFANIYTQYANIHPAFIEPTLGSQPSNIEKTEQEFKVFIEEAHKRGIRIILDVVTHGVMSYSPLASINYTFPSYVKSHPLQSTITAHPDWFGIFSSPADDETRDPNSYPCDTKMIDYVGGYEQNDLEDWWVNVWTNYVLDYGIDGLKLDLGSSRFDLWARIKENAYATGHELIILPEGEMDDYPFDVGIYDVELISWEWTSFAPTLGNERAPGLGITVNNMERAEEEIFPLLKRQFFIIPISCHDSNWYDLQGSRFRMGYGSIFTPFIPLFIAGEEFDNPYTQIPTDTARWLLASELQWTELNKQRNALFFQDMQKSISIRKTEPTLNYFSPEGNKPNVVVVDNFTSSLSGTPSPYLRFLPEGNQAVLIVGNNKPNQNMTITMKVPLNGTDLGDSEYYEIQDLWNRNATYVSKQQLAEFETMVEPDNFRIFKITSAGDTNPIFFPVFSLIAALVSTAVAIVIAQTISRKILLKENSQPRNAI